MPLVSEEELKQYPPPPLPNWIVKRGLLASASEQISVRKPDRGGRPGEVYWQSNPGPQTWVLRAPFDEVLCGGSRGGGKLSPLDSLVCTPKGFREMGSIEVGDMVTDPTTGGACRVIQVHPHPPMPIWKFTFDDGASLEVGADHLWAYRLSSHIRPGTKHSSEREFAREVLSSHGPARKWERYRVGKTSEIRTLFEGGKKIRIPLSEPVTFTCLHRRPKGNREIDLYMVGLFLGDGHIHSLALTSIDPEIIHLCRGLGFSERKKSGTDALQLHAKGEYRKNLKSYFLNNNLNLAHSWEKFIPPQVKHGTIKERLDILRGLLDTDGTVDDRGRVYFASSSEQLAKDVQFVVRSLGGKARIRQKKSHYTTKDGAKVQCRTCYTVRIWHPKTSALFNLERKKKRCTDSWNGGRELSRELIRVEYVGEKPAQCITVSSPYGLYLGNDFVVTHNSQALIAWFAMGDPSLDKEDPAYWSFLLEPSYRALILRKEYQSMAEFVDECADFFGPLGGKPKGEPVEFHFKSGAIVYTNHLGDKEAYNKYKGWGISRIGIEELTQIEEERSYLKLLGSLRAKKQVRRHNGKEYPALHSQIMSTTNPDGDGAIWVAKRFVKVLDPKGRMIPWNRPMRDPFTGLWRIFIPMSRMDNRYLRNDKQYEGMLLSQDEVTRRQWIGGEWLSAGRFFAEWRPNGPTTIEEREKYPWANHVIDGVDLKPYWHRFGGGDWGFEHPAAWHKFCKSDKDGRIHIYDELMLRHLGSFEMGVRLAEWWLPDIEGLPDKTVTINMSSDAFSKTDDSHTKAEQLAAGIKKVLGPYGAFLLKFTDEERVRAASDPEYARRMFAQHRSRADGGFVIVLKPASKDTEARWAYMRDMLRFRPIVTETADQLKERLKATYDRAGAAGDEGAAVVAYERELAKLKRPEGSEVLPRLQVWKRCGQLIRCMEEANRDEDHPNKIKKWDAVEGVGGDDALESAGQGLIYFKEVERVMPKMYYMQERMESIQNEHEQAFGERLEDPTRLAMIKMTQDARWEAQHAPMKGGIFLPRNSVSRHRQPHGQRSSMLR